MLKKFVLVALLCVGLMGCGKKNNKPNTTINNPPPPTTISEPVPPAEVVPVPPKPENKEVLPPRDADIPEHLVIPPPKKK